MPKTVFVTDGGWNDDVAPKVCASLRAQPELVVIDDHEYKRFKREGNLPPIDACVCTSVNVSGQGEWTEERLRRDILAPKIPLALVGGSGEKDVQEFATLHLDYHDFRAEFISGQAMTPPAIQRILQFVETVGNKA